MKTLANRKHGCKEMNGLSCLLPSLTERSWCGAEEIMGFRGFKICATRADEPKSNLVFYKEAHAAFVAGCAGYAEAFSPEMNTFAD
jgi:hypothetical protein